MQFRDLLLSFHILTVVLWLHFAKKLLKQTPALLQNINYTALYMSSKTILYKKFLIYFLVIVMFFKKKPQASQIGARQQLMRLPFTL